MPKNKQPASSTSFGKSAKYQKVASGSRVAPNNAAPLIKSFQGLIRHSESDGNKVEDIVGKYTTFYPTNSRDVQIVIQLSKLLKQKLIVRSGLSECSNIETDGNNSFVINLCHLKDCQVSKNKKTVTMSAGVTNASFADTLIHDNLFLPVSDYPDRSVLSSVLNKDLGYFSRSAGTLQDFVTKVTYTTHDEVDVQLTEASDIVDLFKGSVEDAVITHLTFDVSEPAENYWIHRFCFVYNPKSYEALVKSIFSATHFPKHVDLLIRLVQVQHNMHTVDVSIAGNRNESDVEDCLDYLRSFEDIKMIFLDESEFNENTPDANPFQVFNIVDTHGIGILRGIGSIKMGREHYTSHESRVPMKGVTKRSKKSLDTNKFVQGYLQNMVELISHEPSQLSSGTNVHTKLSLLPGNYIKVIADISHRERQVSGTQRILLNRLGGVVQKKALKEKVFDNIYGLAVEVRDLLHRSEPAHPIPGFKGLAFDQQDPQYSEKATQYATSSYVGKPWLQPKIVAYPVDAQDIAAAIQFAKDSELNIMARSGGHQYCGLSSGDKETIVLSMDKFNSVSVSNTGLAIVGPGTKLINAATKFQENHVTIPHGECPWVCIGGHVQTGGFGHILRSYGCCLDHVQYFKIVLASGKEEVVVKPGNDSPSPTLSQDTNDRLFKSVLGGGPGSFGVVTQLAFQAIQDGEHPYSAGYSAVYPTINPFNSKQLDIERFKVIMNEVKLWTHGKWTAPSGKQEPIPDDVDLMMSAIGGTCDFSNLMATRPTTILLEMVYGNKDGKKGKNYGTEPFKAFTDRVYDAEYIWLPKKWLTKSTEDLDESERGISYWSREFVRDPMLRTDGREFELPYKKRVQCTNFPLTDEFVEGFIDRCDKVQNTKGLNLVYQMAIGGAEFKKFGDKNITGLNHRGFSHQLVFDIFYDTSENANAENDAIELQSEMKKFLLKSYSKSEDIRMIWGSFDESKSETEETSLDNPKVVHWYYDDEDKYMYFQKVKALVDPTDIFHNRFTVQQPL